ncbi:MAG: caspase family protein, partial [Planctomycetia bacterium]|nr:caspase family protein [Planctomycetia bacterium]
MIFYPSTTHARMLAVVIGVSEYEKDSGIRSLPFVQNDAGRIAYTLKEGGNFEVYPLYATKNGSDSPTKQNIETTLRQVLSPDVCHPDDTVVVYFSGHGTISSRDKEKTLLLARDSIFHKEETTLSAQWIREQLKKCPARHKLFLLDTCHSGGKRSVLTQLTSSLVEGGEEGVITLASCKIHQKS